MSWPIPELKNLFNVSGYDFGDRMHSVMMKCVDEDKIDAKDLAAALEVMAYISEKGVFRNSELNQLSSHVNPFVDAIFHGLNKINPIRFKSPNVIKNLSSEQKVSSMDVAIGLLVGLESRFLGGQKMNFWNCKFQDFYEYYDDEYDYFIYGCLHPLNQIDCVLSHENISNYDHQENLSSCDTCPFLPSP
ncbi:MAG: hypothetical protein AAFY20_18475 [Cyanobacteria bacterium J06639_14]